MLELFNFWIGLALGTLLGIGVHFVYNYYRAQNFLRMIQTISKGYAEKINEVENLKKLKEEKKEVI